MAWERSNYPSKHHYNPVIHQRFEESNIQVVNTTTEGPQELLWMKIWDNGRLHVYEPRNRKRCYFAHLWLVRSMSCREGSHFRNRWKADLWQEPQKNIFLKTVALSPKQFVNLSHAQKICQRSKRITTLEVKIRPCQNIFTLTCMSTLTAVGFRFVSFTLRSGFHFHFR